MATFTTVPKQRLSWPAPEVTVSVEDRYLLIGGGYRLLIGGGYKLIIASGGRADAVWTPITKSQYS